MKHKSKQSVVGKKKCIILSCAPYQLTFFLCVGLTEVEFEKRFIKYFRLDAVRNGPFKNRKLDFATLSGHTAFYGSCVGVWLKIWDNSASSVASLVHELTHVVSFVLRDRGLELNDSTEEAYAYLLQELLLQALNKL